MSSARHLRRPEDPDVSPDVVVPGDPSVDITLWAQRAEWLLDKCRRALPGLAYPSTREATHLTEALEVAQERAHGAMVCAVVYRARHGHEPRGTVPTIAVKGRAPEAVR